jgi:hypothetical protein
LVLPVDHTVHIDQITFIHSSPLSRRLAVGEFPAISDAPG